MTTGRFRAIFPRGSKRLARAAVCVFFAAFLLLGFLTVPDYGQPWDELDEMDILRMNLWEYARALHMDETVFEGWARRESLSINALMPISQSIERDHGQCAFYPLAGLVLRADVDEHTRMLGWHGWCWALFTLGAFALYACCRELGLRRLTGLAAAAFLLLSPRFFAEGHYNNKDIVLMALCLCTLWQGLALMRKPGFGRGLAFSLFGAAAANTKLAGLLVWGLCALFVLLAQIVKKRLNGRVLGVGAVTLLSFAALYALLTPALWPDPAGFLRYLLTNSVAFSRWENNVLFRGTVFATWQTPLPRYYLPYMMLATTPLWLLLLMALGQGVALRRMRGNGRGESEQGGRERGESEHRNGSENGCATRFPARGGAHTQAASLLPPCHNRPAALVLLTLLWALPLGFAVIAGVSVYNGWRHFYFIYGPLLLLAALGTETLCAGGWLRRRKRLRAGLLALLVLCMAATGVGMAVNHPYTYTYYQPLVRSRGDAFLELDYWNVSVQNALCALAQKTEGELSVGFADLWAETGLRRGLVSLPQSVRGRVRIAKEPALARYVLLNPTYALYSGFQPSADMAVCVSVEAYGQPIMLIFENASAH